MLWLAVSSQMQITGLLLYPIRGNMETLADVPSIGKTLSCAQTMLVQLRTFLFLSRVVK